MSSTRSPSRPVPVTELLIVAHGSPSVPEPQERFVRQLAARVCAESGIEVRGATLAKAGSLEAAVDGLRSPMVFPHFMADGWFVSTQLQNRLAATRLANWQTLPPLGLLATLPDLAARTLSKVTRANGMRKGEATLVIAAHGSPSDPRPARATENFAEAMRATRLFGSVRVGYVDEEPSLEDAARLDGPGILLPFFAASAGHVLIDLPEAVEAAAFTGPVLAPIGAWDEIPFLIADAVPGLAISA